MHGFYSGMCDTNEAQIRQYEAIYRSKDHEFRCLEEKLHACLIQDQAFKRKSQEVLLSALKEGENLKRLQRKRWIASERLRIGEFIERRVGSQFKEVWMDGYELLELRRVLSQISKQKETLMALNKSLKKKAGKPGQSHEKTSFQGNAKSSHVTSKATSNSTPQAKSTAFPFPQTWHGSPLFETCLVQVMGPLVLPNSNIEHSDSSNSLSLNDEVNIEEAKEQIGAQLLHLNREEAFYKEKIEASEAQKRRFKILAKHSYQEENCLFAQPECSWPILNERYQVLSFLSKSSRCETYKVFDRVELKEKTCELIDTVSFGSDRTDKSDHQAIAERFQILKQIAHPHIVQYLDCYLVGPNLSCLISDFCNGQSVFDFLKKSRTVSERDARSIVSQILSAVGYLLETGKGMLEFDLWPSNLFFHNGAVKIKAGPLKQSSKWSLHSSLFENPNFEENNVYFPPELRSSGSEADWDKSLVWAIGMLLFQMVYGQSLSAGYIDNYLFKAEAKSSGASVELPAKPNISTESKELIRRCLVFSLENRPSIRDLINTFTKG